MNKEQAVQISNNFISEIKRLFPRFDNYELCASEPFDFGDVWFFYYYHIYKGDLPEEKGKEWGGSPGFIVCKLSRELKELDWDDYEAAKYHIAVMGKFYYLFRDPEKHYILLAVLFDSLPNSDDGCYEKIVDKIESKISEFINGRPLELIGRLEDEPIGEVICKAKDGDILNLFYCLNRFDNDFVIFGTGKDKISFLAEAIDNYSNLLDKNTISSVKAIYCET